jgi:hypothetical protein
VLRRPREVNAQPPGGLSPVDVRTSSPCLKSRGRRVARLVSGREPTRGEQTSARWAGWRLGQAATRRACRTSECPHASAHGANRRSVSRRANRNANEYSSLGDIWVSMCQCHVSEHPGLIAGMGQVEGTADGCAGIASVESTSRHARPGLGVGGPPCPLTGPAGPLPQPVCPETGVAPPLVRLPPATMTAPAAKKAASPATPR